jgi:hypothetical protein
MAHIRVAVILIPASNVECIKIKALSSPQSEVDGGFLWRRTTPSVRTTCETYVNHVLKRWKRDSFAVHVAMIRRLVNDLSEALRCPLRAQHTR